MVPFFHRIPVGSGNPTAVPLLSAITLIGFSAGIPWTRSGDGTRGCQRQSFRHRWSAEFRFGTGTPAFDPGRAGCRRSCAPSAAIAVAAPQLAAGWWVERRTHSARVLLGPPGTRHGRWLPRQARRRHPVAERDRARRFENGGGSVALGARGVAAGPGSRQIKTGARNDAVCVTALVNAWAAIQGLIAARTFREDPAAAIAEAVSST
jgi:hypothetical protein